MTGIQTLMEPPETSALGSDLTAGELAGMRSAAVILLMTAALGLVPWLIASWEPSGTVGPAGAGLPDMSAVIDLVLGVQLLRRRHSWRAWAMLRAGIGVCLGLFVILMALNVRQQVLLLLLSGSGNLAYSSALLLMLYGSPTKTRVVTGWAVYLAAVLLIVASLTLALSLVATGTDG